MKRCFMLLLLATATLLYAGKGKIRVAADKQGAYIYVNGKKKAMTGEGFTSILLDEGEYTIKVVKPIDKYTAYMAEKKLFVGEDTSTKVILTLRREVLTLKTLWDKTFGGKDEDEAYSIIQSRDGGYLVAGDTKSKGTGESDVWILKLDKEGNRVWDRTFGGKGYDEAHSIIQGRDGSYLVAGDTQSKGASSMGAWILKLDKDGNRVWDKTIGGKDNDGARSIIQGRDGGFVVAGFTRSKGAGGADVWILKLDKDGNRVWDRTFGGKDGDYAHSIIQGRDGSYLVAGSTDSKGIGKSDVWILKLDKEGNRVWDRTFGGKKRDEAYSIIQSQGGGYLVAGYTESKGAGEGDVWILKLDKDGNRVWDRTFGGKGWDEARSIIQSRDGGYLVAGYTQSKGAGHFDAWIIKLDKEGNRVWDKTFGGKDGDYAHSIIQGRDGSYLVAGSTDSKGAGYSDVWILKLREKR